MNRGVMMNEYRGNNLLIDFLFLAFERKKVQCMLMEFFDDLHMSQKRLQLLTSIIRKIKHFQSFLLLLFFFDIKVLNGLNPLTSKHCINMLMYTVLHALS